MDPNKRKTDRKKERERGKRERWIRWERGRRGERGRERSKRQRERDTKSGIETEKERDGERIWVSVCIWNIEKGNKEREREVERGRERERKREKRLKASND
jgi:hypothetical protein